MNSDPFDDASPGAPGAGRGCLDRVAFEALFRGCAADVHSYAYSLLGDRASAEDVTALAFERLFRARARLDRSRGTPRSWLFAVARNAAVDELRRRRRRPTVTAADPGGAPDPGEPDAAELAEESERRAVVRSALATLSPRERELVLLKFHGQLSNSELARVLAISETNAGTRLHRALVRLRAACEQQSGERAA
jgi:RNA polymerase sigma-70 factor, ECF subfamily